MNLDCLKDQKWLKSTCNDKEAHRKFEKDNSKLEKIIHYRYGNLKKQHLEFIPQEVVYTQLFTSSNSVIVI